MRAYVYMAVGVLMIFCLSLTPATAQKNDKSKVSAEMRAFMKQMNGDYKNVDAALKKYAAEGADISDMRGIMVREPKITKTEIKDGMTFYTMACKTGIAERTYLIGWKDKKIQKLKQLSFTVP
jgi:hypothetical protein